MPHGLSDEQFQKRVMEVWLEELEHEVRWHYLSFAGDEGFRGAVVIRAHGLTDAMFGCSILNINPGGEVGGPVPDGMPLPPVEFRNKLLSKEQIKSFWPDAESLGTIREEERSKTA